MAERGKMADKVLVVDDEKLIVKGIKYSLEQDGMEVSCAYDGREALDLIKANNYDIILLDVMLPEMDGYTVCQQVREFSDVPIIMITAKSEDMDKILGLDYGADDYITKPFSVDELMARIRCLQRRTNKSVNQNILSFSDISLNLQTYELSCNSASLHLGLKEFSIMEVFISNPNKVISKEILLEKVWGYETDAEYNNVEVYISFLRKKLNHINSYSIIKTIRGVGYRLEELT